MKQIQIVTLSLLLGLTSGCKFMHNDDEAKNPFAGMSAKQLYTEGKANLNKKQYASAAKRFEAIEGMYPFSIYTEKSQLDLVYAYYKSEDYLSSAATADRFIHLYPRASHVDYAYYMKALAEFQQPRGVLAKYLPMDESWRDPGTQAQSYIDFGVLVQKFPESKYKANSLQRMIYLRNMFAQHELNIAKYYFKRKMYVAAIERASYLVKTYPQAPSVQGALIVMYKGNKALGLNSAAEEAMHVYVATYHTNQMDRALLLS